MQRTPPPTIVRPNLTEQSESREPSKPASKKGSSTTSEMNLRLARVRAKNAAEKAKLTAEVAKSQIQAMNAEEALIEQEVLEEESRFERMSIASRASLWVNDILTTQEEENEQLVRDENRVNFQNVEVPFEDPSTLVAGVKSTDGMENPAQREDRHLCKSVCEISVCKNHNHNVCNHSDQCVTSLNENTQAQMLRKSTTMVDANQLAEALGKSIFLNSKVQKYKDLPTFTGNALEWLAFKNLYFNSTKIYSLSNEENLYRLQKSLKGEARESISCLLSSPNNVGIVMKTLDSLFGNHDLIILQLIKEIKTYSPITNSCANRELLKLSCKISNLIATLEDMNNIGHLHNPDLLLEIVNKLPKDLKTMWVASNASQGHGNLIPIKALSKFLSEYVSGFSSAGMSVLTAAGSSKMHNSDFTNKRRDHTFFNKEVKQKCNYCENNHSLSRCEKFSALPMDQRWDFVKAKKLCFKCLYKGHSRNTCVAYKRYPNPEFNPLLQKRVNVQKFNPLLEKSVDIKEDIVTNTFFSSSKVWLKVIPVVLMGPTGCVNIDALLDDGSTITLLDQNIARSIGLNGIDKNLSIQGVNNIHTSFSSQSVSCRIRGQARNKHFKINAHTVNDLKLPALSTVRFKYNKKVECIKFNEIETVPKMLIGMDYWNLIIPCDIEKVNKNVYVGRTELGYVAMQQTSGHAKKHVTLHLSELHDIVRKSFELDSIGICNPKICKQDKLALQTMKDTTRYIKEEKCYETGLLWKNKEIYLPNNYESAKARLVSIEKKMDKDEVFAKAYQEKIHSLLEKGYAVKSREQEPGWYLPHFAVINPNKPGKVRVVFDGAATYQGVCLNDRLVTGPDFYNNIITMLFKFREEPIALCADIQEMFLRIKIIEKDQPYQLFLWHDGDRSQRPSVYKMKSMLFGARCSPSSAQYVRNTNAERFVKQFPKEVDIIKNQFFVDDLLSSVTSIQEAQSLVRNLINIMDSGGFKLISWASNEKEALCELEDAFKSNGMVTISDGDNSEPTQRTLGLQWNPQTDCLSFDLTFKKLDKDIRLGSRVPTKREMLKLIMTIYDPCGYICIISVRAKILLQNVWRSGIGWDDPLNEVNFNQWRDWLRLLDSCSKVQIKRHYEKKNKKVHKRELHVFCDASEQAMCCAAYARVEYEDSTLESYLISAKTRVSPLKHTSIPRLELQAALLGSRLAVYIRSAHTYKFDDIIMWTDSATVKCWVQNESRNFQSYVANRLGEIEELVGNECWHWLPTHENVADEGTRNTGTIELGANSRWFKGPSFLRQPREYWPIWKHEQVSKESMEHKQIILNIVSTDQGLVDVYRFSKLDRLHRSMAYVLLFINICKNRSSASRIVEVEHIRMSETHIIKERQNIAFKQDIKNLSNKINLDSKSRLRGLDPFIDSTGVMRVNSRFATVEYVNLNIIYPIILDGKDHYSKLIIRDCHEKHNHIGVEHTLRNIRDKYWLISGRQVVRQVIHACVKCRLASIKPVVPMMGMLPKDRLKIGLKPFSVTGIDYFGPINVRIGRRNEKRYGVLFTCLTVRAVHIELADTLNTDSTIMALRRFIARRGKPEIIWSDNGTNLRGADSELRKHIKNLDKDKIQQSMCVQDIKWKYICPGTPHMGGAWESLVRSIKTSLYTVLKEQAPRAEVLHTLLLEAESIVNSRPLTHVSLDGKDEPCLTPNHFLLGYSYESSNLGTFEIKCLKRQWKVAQYFADRFWQRWVKEYLPTLTERRKWKDNNPSIQVGDLGILCEDSLPRNCWPRGIVVKVYPSSTDGRIRVVDFKTPKGIYKRPVTKIAVLKLE